MWKDSLNSLTWAEILRQILVAAGFGSVKRAGGQSEELSKVLISCNPFDSLKQLSVYSICLAPKILPTNATSLVLFIRIKVSYTSMLFYS